ncbi:MAG TPA: GntR family transcriptional regulator [Nakamurella sp.]|nr:GntR family transcriptional regulator [Nakamurella sp.]
MPASRSIQLPAPVRLHLEIDRSSPVPLYFQLTQQIEAAIAGGSVVAGARLPNEVALADELGLSRETIRQAYGQLMDRGLLARKRGVGTVVMNGYVNRSLGLTSLYDDLRRANQSPSTTVVSRRVSPAAADVADALQVPVGTRVLAIERVRFAAGAPLGLLRNWLPPAHADLTAEELTEFGLYQLLRSRGVRLHVASQRVGAASVAARDARLIGERRGATVLTTERTVYDDNGRPVEFGRDIYRADRYYFEMTAAVSGAAIPLAEPARDRSA